jgi:diguanylate cyclase (GGDEF)-like protein
MLVAIAWISFFLWSTQELRGAMLLIYIFVAMFSLFTLTPRQTAAMGLAVSLVYAIVIVLDWWSAATGFDLTINVIQWGIVSAALMWLVAIAKYMSGVRDKLARSSKMIRLQNAEIQRANEQLENALSKLKRLVITDELTGLSNRRHLLETINVHIESCHNDQFEFGLCMLDLDNFKMINDTFGHQVGDQVLRVAAELMRQNMREYDFLARYGGEEFTLIVTRGDEAVTLRCAERLRRAMADADLSDLALGVSLTVSIGATVFRPGDSLQTALDRADAALYQAKQAGRNTCVMELAEDRAKAN